MGRRPKTATEMARAVYYAIEQARNSLPLPEGENRETFGAHCVLANTAIMSLIAELEGKNFRDLIGEPGFDNIRVTGWHFDWWPDYPDWVFDGDSTT